MTTFDASIVIRVGEMSLEDLQCYAKQHLEDMTPDQVVLHFNANALQCAQPIQWNGQCASFTWELEQVRTHLRLRCAECKQAPARSWWLAQHHTKRRKNGAPTLGEVLDACGRFCYGCGASQELLLQNGIHLCVHHAQSYAEHGHAGPFIPLCGDCHESITLMQRIHRRLTATNEGAA